MEARTLTKKGRNILASAQAAAGRMSNKMFGELYVHAVEQQLLYNDPTWISFIEHLEREPVDIETFMDGEQFLGATDLSFWPEVRKTLVEINSHWWKGPRTKNNPNGAYRDAVFCGATGTGKSEMMKCCFAYHLYLLSCLKKPQTLYNLPSSTSIVMVIQAARPIVCKKVVYAPLRKNIEEMPYFKEHMPFDPYIEAEMYFPEKNIRLVPGGVDTDAVLGEALIMAGIDEINFMQVVQQSKKAEVISGRAGVYNQADAVYATVSARRKGRFNYMGPQIGMVIESSSKRYNGDFTDRQKERARKDPAIYIYDRKQYEVQPHERADGSKRFCGEKFRLLIGSQENMAQTRIMEEGEVAPPEALVEEVPIEYISDFRNDLQRALRDVLGISDASLAPFIRQRAKVLECVQVGDKRGLSSFLVKDNVVLGLEGMPQIIPGFFCRNTQSPRYVHIDLAKNSDRCGIAMLRYDGMTTVTRGAGGSVVETLPTATVELACTIEPDANAEIDIAEVRAWVAKLKSDYGFPIMGISYDGWNCVSVDTQVWTNAGLRRAGDVQVGDIVQTRSGPQPVLKKWNYGRADTLVVTTQHGHSIEMTDQHKIEALYRWDEVGGRRKPEWRWVKAADLVEGQVVRIWDQPSEVDNAKYQRLAWSSEQTSHNGHYRRSFRLDEVTARAIGLLHGDGSFGSNYFTITCCREEVTEAETILMDAFDFESKITWRRKDYSNGYTAQVTNTDFLRYLRLNGLATKYQVPEMVRRSPKSVQAAFISGLFAADCSVKERDGQVSLETVSKEYADYLMVALPMLFGLGVNLTERKGRKVTLPQGDTAFVDSWIVTIRGSRSEFLDRIGIAYATKNDRLLEHADVAGRRIFSKVKSIIRSSSDVVDFEVQDDHSYLANGFVSHNSLESRQQWKQQGMPTAQVSVDEKGAAKYKALRVALNDNRIAMYDQPQLLKELFELEYDEEKDKVDHPPNGHKDIADAVCAAFHVLITRRQSWGIGPASRDSQRMADTPRFDSPRR